MKFVQENDELTVVGEAKDGLELLELLEISLPDMVIKDISMPRLGGLEASKKIKELYPQIKVLILTLHEEKDFQHQAIINGVDGYILKMTWTRNSILLSGLFVTERFIYLPDLEQIFDLFPA